MTKCSECGVSGVKLWRETHAYSHAPTLLCVACASAVNGSDPGLVNDRGVRPIANGSTDQIGWFVPAVPDGNGNWWGYTSIPQDAYDAWAALPNA